MDKVRLGRALGYGTRHAAKTLAAVAEAAAAPDPRGNVSASADSPVSARPAQPHTAATPRRTSAAAAGPRRPELVRSVWRPLATFSSVVSLQVSGTFFALLAATFGTAAWRTFAAHPIAGSPERGHLWLLLAITVLFTYFAGSSFWKANRRSKGA